MRRGMWIGVLLLMILVAIAVGVGAYNAGLSEGLERSGGEVVRVVDRGFGFHFGLILFPLFFIGIFALLRGAFWRGRWGGPEPGHWGPGHWSRGGHERFEEWHRRQHDQAVESQPGSGDAPASV